MFLCIMNFFKLPKTENFKHLSGKELDQLDRRKSAQQKIFGLVNMLELTKEDLSERKQLIDQMHYHLTQFYPQCQLLIYGSTVNGFGFKGCDLDLLFMPFPEYCNTDFKTKVAASIPSPYHILRGMQNKKELLNLNETEHLKFVRKVFFMKHMFQQIIFIPAKCPILLLKIFGHDFECDLSASNRFVLGNTELLHLFSKMDSRVRPVAMVLRYWAKLLGFISKINLSSYAMSLLIIFALQNTEPPVLPSVKSLIETSGYSCIIDGFETAFNKNVGSMPMFNLDSVEKLVDHFFSFYWNFDFSHYVVSPYYGKSLPIKDLKESNDERLRNFPVNTFSIQDPFILKNNLSRNASILTTFKIALLIARELISDDNNFSIHQFLSSAYYQKHMDSVYEPTLSCFLENSAISIISLTYEIVSKLNLTSDLKPWFEKVMSTVLDVLNFGLLIECEVIDKIVWMDKTIQPKKKRKINILDSLKNLELLMSIQCTVYFNTWISRNKKEPAANISDIDLDIPDALKKEYSISKLFFPESSVITVSPVVWLCDCYKYPVDQLTDIILIFTPFSDSVDISKVTNSLKTYVKKTVEKLLNEG